MDGLPLRLRCNQFYEPITKLMVEHVRLWSCVLIEVLYAAIPGTYPLFICECIFAVTAADKTQPHNHNALSDGIDV